MPRTAFRVAFIAAASFLGGCTGNYIGTGYATVPVQLVVTRQGRFEILDRPEFGRVAISPTPARVSHWTSVEGLLDSALTHDRGVTNSASSPGSWYFGPLMDYFSQNGRSCRLIRGEPLIEPQWEFVYDCAPGFDSSAITWNPSGYSNAPLPPPPPRR
jgi:hypothetical protein